MLLWEKILRIQKKLTVMWSLNKMFLVGNVGIAPIPCLLSCQILVNFFWICIPNDCI